MPGEWENQSGVLITWPHVHSDWSGNLAAIETLYIQLSREICLREKLLVIAYDLALKKHIESLFKHHQLNLSNLHFFIAKTNDTWTRDYGPICLTQDDQVHLLDFQFNGWGGKYNASLDNHITHQLLVEKKLKPSEVRIHDFILEGGSIESDGAGTVLTTSSCLLSKSRNELYSKKQIHLMLQNTLSAKNVLWLDHGYLAGDDTDSHIDVLARFTDENTIVHIKQNDPNDEHFSDSQAMETQLKSFRNVNGNAYHLVSLPFPAAKYDEDGRRLPASYANFLIINQAVLVPTYDDAQDRIALNILQQQFKNRDIIGIPFNAAIQQNGSLHCLTMQLPAGVL